VKSLTVSEVFGPTVQGEGPSAGRRAVFVRLALCNLDCRWCDTAYTWDWAHFDRKAETHRATVEHVADQVADRARWRDLVVITGGEPLVQLSALADLLATLGHSWSCEVETNGTIRPGPCTRLARWNVSPKLAHSGVARQRAWVPEALAAFAELPGTAFKFVATQPADLDEVDELVALVGIEPSQVWIMPEGCDADTVTRRLGVLADDVIDRGYNLTGRLHVMVWGDQRGR
jgi:7-carboxy-7-deazaguanine synthase